MQVIKYPCWRYKKTASGFDSKIIQSVHDEAEGWEPTPAKFYTDLEVKHILEHGSLPVKEVEAVESIVEAKEEVKKPVMVELKSGKKPAKKA